MKVLPDSHILIWTLNGDSRLSPKARDLILAPENRVYFSVVSIWEIAVKHAVRPQDVEFTGLELAWYCHEAGFEPLNLEVAHISALEKLSRPADAPPHKDPFDRMLIAQAKAENMTFLTHDALLSDYNENCVVLV